VTRIVVYYPSNRRSNALEAMTLAIHRRGIPIELLTTCEAGALHRFLASQGIPAYAHPLSKRWSTAYYPRQIGYLVRYCRGHEITTVFSNLQHANLISVFAQYLCRARFVIFRHHFNFALPGDELPLKPGRMERIFDEVINRLAREIVVPSTGVYEGMRDVERADMSRVSILPYMYEFDRYGQPDADAVDSIRSRYPARLTLLMCARLVPLKRHGLVFPVVRDLINEGLNLRMFVLDDGPERESLEAFVRRNHLEERIIMLGFRTDFLEYMAAADLLVHPSLTDASSNVVKEMGLLGKTVVACSGVGDFDDYLEHGRNAFLVPRSTDGSEIAEILRGVYSEPSRLNGLGESLRATVLERFSVQPESVDRYLELASRSAEGTITEGTPAGAR
jgi:glycosyltransferase involved in cell wall biosynthesis